MTAKNKIGKSDNPAKWASVAEARKYIMANLSSPIRQKEIVPIQQALGRVLAKDIIAPFNVPAHDNSAMDGYACRVRDLSANQSVTLSVVGRAFAGAPYQGKALANKECIRIMTGAPIPKGANIIIPQEETQSDAHAVTIMPASRKSGMHIRQAGEDLQKGKAALHGGELCTPAHIGLIASLGLAKVSVWRRLRVAFMSTGDELKTAGQKLGSGDVYDSNRHSIAAMIARCGFEGIDMGLVADEPKQLAAAMDKAAACADVIIASGGASVGEADYIRPVLSERGKVLFWKVAMRPGRPLSYGKVRRADFFGLPGNPVSVMVCFYQFVMAALWHRAGRMDYCAPPLFSVRAGASLKKSSGRTEYQRGILRWEKSGWVVYPTGAQGSGILSSMAVANCFIVLESDIANVAQGDMVKVQMFDGLV